ncbi:MAG: 4Fe-4S dicluster domain-containing protein [Deltaproteobacteria bacterium]|nr:4Fe-4S dicluster domain-containing protein [Candidatus Anaeroferrophillacea bacterium]
MTGEKKKKKIKKPRGTARLIPGKCIACGGRCEAACPAECITMNDQGEPVIDAAGCIGCKKCTKVCPAEAIEIHFTPEELQLLAEREQAGGTADEEEMDPEQARIAARLKEYRDVWVFVEQTEGEPATVSWELLGVGTRLARKLGVRLGAVVIGSGVENLCRESFAYGAEVAYLVDAPAFRHYRTETYRDAVCRLVNKHKPRVLLTGATGLGRDLAGAVATGLATGLNADCTELDVDDQGFLLQTRPAFGGNIMATIVTGRHRPQMSTVRPHVMPLPERDPDRTGEVVSESMTVNERHLAVEVLEIIRDTKGTDAVDVTAAEVIVAGGAGMQTKENFAILQELADELGGVVGATVTETEIWDCTTYGACVEHCPVFIEPLAKIIDMRRYLVETKAAFPHELLNFFENVENRGNPWGIAPPARAKWTADITVPEFAAGTTEYLYYVGCAGAFDSRSIQISRAIAKILDAADISWGTLGVDEPCCGDSMRRLGNEFEFERMVKKNIGLLREHGVRKIVVNCPHGYTTLKHDYRQFGGEFEVIHYSELIAELITAGRLKLKPTADLGRMVFHDSCYLSRYNGIYEALRRVIGAATGAPPAEMERHHESSFCCGAGGGRMWLEEDRGERINIARVREAAARNPDTVCTACPYCLTMFEDGLKDEGKMERIKTLDLTEVVIRALQ